MDRNELVEAITVEITTLNAAEYYGEWDVCAAVARVEALEWVLGLIDTTITHAAGTPRLLTTMENSYE